MATSECPRHNSIHGTHERGFVSLCATQQERTAWGKSILKQQQSDTKHNKSDQQAHQSKGWDVTPRVLLKESALANTRVRRANTNCKTRQHLDI